MVIRFLNRSYRNYETKFEFCCLAGPLCLAKHHPSKDRRLDDNFPTFKKFNRTLRYSCEEGDPAVLEVTPNSSWPDVVYYNSFTHANMGWKIHIVDTYARPTSSAAYIKINYVICVSSIIYSLLIHFLI